MPISPNGEGSEKESLVSSIMSALFPNSEPDTSSESEKNKDKDRDKDNENEENEENEEELENHDMIKFSSEEKETSSTDDIFPDKHYEEEYKAKYGDDVDSSLAERMEKDSNFESAMERSFENEGGYADRPNDPGGETKYGISTAQYGDTEDIKNIDRDRAKYIYYRDYYEGPGYDELPDGIRDQVFDAGIYKGTPTVTRILQRESGAKVDGIIGPETISKVESMDKKDLSERLFNSFNEDNDEKMRNNPKLEENRNGWYNRNERMTVKY